MIKCSLCQLPFKITEMDKRLPLKMLMTLQKHMQSRKICNLFPTIRCITEQFMMHNCRVCVICYQIIVQEYALIEVFFCLILRPNLKWLLHRIFQQNLKFLLKF